MIKGSHTYKATCDFCGEQQSWNTEHEMTDKTLPAGWRIINSPPGGHGEALDLCAECCTSLEATTKFVATIVTDRLKLYTGRCDEKITLAWHICKRASEQAADKLVRSE